MPSTTTTTVTIGSILDLIGPATSSTAIGDSQTGFDSLLQAVRPPAPPPPTPPAVDSRPSTTADSRSTDRNPQPPANQPAAGDQTTSNSNQDQTSSQPAPAPSAPPAANNSNKGSGEHQDSNHDADKTEDQAATEQILAQSLAGLPTATKNAPEPVIAPTDAPASAKDQTTDAAKTSNAPAANTGQLKVANSQSKASAADTEAPASEETNTASAKQASKTATVATDATAKNSPAQETVVKPQAGDKVEAVKKDDQDKQSSDDSQQSFDVQLTNTDKSQPLPAKHEQSSSTDAPSPLALDASALAAPAVDGTNSQAVAAAPLVAPTANLTPVVDQPAAAQSNNSSAPTAISNAPTRSRLPAQALAPATNASTRHAPVEVDAARLISRVVRAFSAAQDRDGEVRLRLSPPELGSLQLDVRVENGALTAHLQTETDSARLAIIDNLPTLRDRLADQGVRIERFDVDLMQRQPGGMPDQPGGRQQDTPEAPLRFAPPTPSAATTAPIATNPSPSLGSTSGLNVVI